MYINDNLAVDLHLETWRWSKLQTSEKSMCFVFSELPEIISFFFLSLLSLFEKKFLIWSMRKPRVINIILSSSVKFTVNQVLWMWAYALAPVLRVLYSQLHFRFEFEQLSLSITLKCLLFWLPCHNFHQEYCYLRGLKCLAEFQPPFFLFLYTISNLKPLPNCWQIFAIFFFFFLQLFKFDMDIEIHQVINSSIYIITFIVILSSVDFTTLIKGGYSLLRTISAWNTMITSFRKQVIHNWM